MQKKSTRVRKVEVVQTALGVGWEAASVISALSDGEGLILFGDKRWHCWQSRQGCSKLVEKTWFDVAIKETMVSGKGKGGRRFFIK